MHHLQRFPRWAIAPAVVGFALLAWTFARPTGPHLHADQRDPEPGSVTPSAAPAGSLVVERCRVHLRDGLELASEQTGIVESVVPPGSAVRTGQLVGQLRDQVLRRALAIAEREASNDIEVRFARKKAELDQLKYERALEANANGEVEDVVPELELRELRLAAEQSLLQLEQAEHQLAVNRLRRDEQAEVLRTYRIVAPLDGLVTKVLVQPGEVVREGEPLLEMANTETMLLHGEIELDRIPLLRNALASGASAVFTTTITGQNGRRVPRDFPARLVTIDVKVEPLSQKVEFTAEVENRESLLIDGLSGRLVVHGASPATTRLGQLFQVPSTATSESPHATPPRIPHSASSRLGN